MGAHKNMTVGEMKEFLKDFDDDAEIMIGVGEDEVKHVGIYNYYKENVVTEGGLLHDGEWEVYWPDNLDNYVHQFGIDWDNVPDEEKEEFVKQKIGVKAYPCLRARDY